MKHCSKTIVKNLLNKAIANKKILLNLQSSSKL